MAYAAFKQSDRIRGSRCIPALALRLIGLFVTANVSAAIQTGTDEDARLPYWEVVEGAVSIRLVQRLPDQTRGFFQARGFSVADAERIATHCLFQTVIKNISPPSNPVVIDYDLRNWTVQAANARSSIVTREDWQQVWRERQAPQAARIAFEWALLPTRQTYRPGDYNWGMTVFELKPGDEFDLDVIWFEQAKERRVQLKGVRCAPDIQVSPAAP